MADIPIKYSMTTTYTYTTCALHIAINMYSKSVFVKKD